MAEGYGKMSDKLKNENGPKTALLNKKNYGRRGLLTAIVLIMIPVLLFYLQEFMLRNPFEKMKGNLQILNIVFWMLLLLLAYTFTGRLKVGVWIASAVALVLGLLNYFVIEFRGTPVQPWDIPSAKVAASVADNYDYSVTPAIVLLALAIVALCVAAGFLKIRLPKLFIKSKKGSPERKGQAYRLILMALSVFLIWGYVDYVQKDSTVSKEGIYDKLFTPTTMTYKDGTPLAFLIQAKYMSVDKPSGYSDEKAREILAKYENDNCVKYDADSTGQSTGKLPNIIVIMNEAYSDLRILQDYETNVEVMPFTDSLMNGGKNTRSGYLNVSVLGGNTADTEYEFLTGDTMAFLPQGSIPYQQYISGDIESMASILKAQGYSTVAMHPYKPAGWNRDKVYDYFGFDVFYSEADYENAEIIRKYVSDKSDFEKIIEEYEGKEAGKPLFVFNVTMQNHSSYSDLFDNFTPDVEVKGVDSVSTNQYLSLIKKSDEAFEELVSYFEKEDEPTIIVMFGDHQPTDFVAAPLYKLNGKSVYDLTDEELALRYKTPFVLWANYDIEESHGNEISPGLLGEEVLDVAGVKTSPYYNYLKELSETVDSVNIMQTIYSDGHADSEDDEAEALKDYRILQYYHLFGKKD